MGHKHRNIDTDNFDEDLRSRVGDDATSDFESDPNFIDANPTANASSENLGAGMTSEDDNSDAMNEDGEEHNLTAIDDDPEV